jgi:hypothetical protein
LIVGAVFEYGLHGSVVGPYVMRTIRRYILGADSLEGRRPGLKVTGDEPATPREPDPVVPLPADTIPPAQTRR